MKITRLYIFVICFIYSASVDGGKPLKKFNYKKAETENIFKEGWCAGVFTDITFYGGKPVNGYGISIEPTINEYISLNYKFALNYRGSENFSVHGNPGSVVSPYLFSMINSSDSNNGGWVVLGILALLIPEGVNLKFIPDGYSQIAFAGYINPIGIDYARKNPGTDKSLYMSGEIGAKAYFVVKNGLYLNAFGGIRSIYLFKYLGLSVGIQAGWVIGTNKKPEEKQIYTY